MFAIKKLMLIFFVVCLVSVLGIVLFDEKMGAENFWDHHGPFFLIAIAVFPRLTLLLSSVPFGDILWWLGFFFLPRYLIAILATLAFWRENPILVTASWLFAFGGESYEKTIIHRRTRQQKPGGITIDAEYRDLSSPKR